jgi:proteasome lid subunit RPN8/RPN11
MYKLTTAIGDAIRAHAWAVYQDSKREACGVVIRTAEGDAFRPIRNIVMGDQAQDRFVMCPRDLAEAEDAGEIVAIVHSHPDASAHPSHADRVMCRRSGLPWLVISVPGDVILQASPQEPPLDLVGREFHHGVVDCYSLIQDYYSDRLGLTLPHFDRADDWWEHGLDLYRDNFAAAGFVQVGGREVVPQPHDVIIMQVRSDKPNHGAVMDAEQPGMILHHLWGRPSCHDVWGGYWQQHTAFVLRHETLVGAAA